LAAHPFNLQSGHTEHGSPTEDHCPSGHAVHAFPSGPVHPELHVHAVEAVLCSGEMEFDGQASHSAVPETALYLPAAHCEHSPFLLAENPALHVQLVAMILPTGESEFVGQLVQLALPR